MIYDIVHHPNYQELSIDEALRRIIVSFPRVVVDRHRGNEVRKSWGLNCGSFKMNQTEYRLRQNSDDAAWVSIDIDSVPTHFVLEQELEIFFKFLSKLDRRTGRPAIQKIADVLGYEVSDWPVFVHAQIEFGRDGQKSEFLIAEELNINSQLDESLRRHGLNANQIQFQGSKAIAEIVVEDDVIDIEAIREAVLEAFPRARLRMKIPSDSLPRCF